jgi:hypothetical protein
MLFTGRPLEFKKEFGLAFGDYVEAYEGATNTMTARSTACIALCPTNNSTGAWVLWKIATRSRIRRTNWVKLVTTQLIIDAMNAVARESTEQEGAPTRQLQRTIVSQQSAAERASLEDPAEILEETQLEPEEESEGEVEEVDDTPELAPQDQGDESDDEAEEDNNEEMTGPTVTRSGRKVRRPSRFAGVTKVA